MQVQYCQMRSCLEKDLSLAACSLYNTDSNSHKICLLECCKSTAWPSHYTPKAHIGTEESPHNSAFHCLQASCKCSPIPLRIRSKTICCAKKNNNLHANENVSSRSTIYS